MDLITGANLTALEKRLMALDDTPLPPEISQLLIDAYTLLDQVHEMRVRRSQLTTALKEALEPIDGRTLL